MVRERDATRSSLSYPIPSHLTGSVVVREATAVEAEAEVPNQSPGIREFLSQRETHPPSGFALVVTVA